MDNEAFRALVAERSKPKSTKEIAREAVEQEFRDKRSRAGGKKRRRGGGGGGGGSSSDEDGGGRGAAGNEDDSDDDDFDRRNRDDGRGGEDDGGDNNDDGNEKEPKWKRERRAKKRAKEEAEGKVRYRDRAKERREGRTNADYAGIEEAVAAAGASAAGAGAGAGEDGVAVLGGAEADMTKYLGGDESRTHLVRGLDWALAQKVRREEMGLAGGGSNDRNVEEAGGVGLGGDSDANLERILQSSRAEKSDGEALRRAIQNLSSASSDRNDPQDVLTILNRLQNTAQTTSGRGMAAFLINKTSRSSKMETTKKKKLTTTNAGRTLQRTKLQFSLRCHPGDVLRSWEVPREEVSSVVEHERRRQKGSNVPFGEKLTPFDHNFLARIRAAFVPSMPSSSDKKISNPLKKGHDARKKSKNQEGVGMGEGNKDDAETTSPVISEKKQISAVEGNNDGDAESSDEDIFGGIGKYQPSVPAASKDAAGVNGKVPAAGKTKSIFEGLTSEPDSIIKSKTSAPISNVPSAPTASEEKNVIDRDVFGGRPVDKGTPAVRLSDGVSLSVSEYGYGEDIDTDFTGVEEDEAAKGKKGGDVLTTAALEYGRRSGS